MTDTLHKLARAVARWRLDDAEAERAIDAKPYNAHAAGHASGKAFGAAHDVATLADQLCVEKGLLIREDS